MHKSVNKDITTLFNDEGVSSNKNNDWFYTDNLIISFDEEGTCVKMPKKGLYNYSPNITISGDFIVSADILMPEGNSFLSFGFNNNQNTFLHYRGWWKTSSFEKVYIKRTDGYIKFFLGNQLKGAIELDLDELFFQFRLYSSKGGFEFKFRNFQISSLKYDQSSYAYLSDKLENIDCKINLLKSSVRKIK